MRGTTQALKFEVSTFNNTTARSNAVDMQSYVGASVSIALTGASIAGSAKLQGSNNGTTWYDIDSVSIAGPGSYGINKADIYWSLVSVLLTSTDTNVVTIGAVQFAAKGH